MKKALFDNFALIYDQDMDKKDDIELYLNYAKKNQCYKILDIGCGTGRVSIPLIKQGHLIVGNDISKKMLDVFKKKIGKSDNRKKYYLFNLNALDLTFSNETFDMIIMAYDVFLHFTTLEEQIDILEKCRSWLKTSGILIIDVFRQHYKELVDYKDFYMLDYVKRYFARFKCILPNFDSQVNILNYKYQDLKKEKEIMRTNKVRWVSYSEFLLMFKLCRLNIKESFGNYDKTPCIYSQPRMIFILEKEI